MKTLSLRLAAAISLMPALANAHPGHSAFDLTAGRPHPGHELEFSTLLLVLAVSALALGAARWIARRR